MRLWLTAGACGLGLLASSCRAASAGEVSLPMQDAIEDKLSGAFISPQTAIWHFDADVPYISGERLVCGWVNFESAQQKYVGYHQFYAITFSGAVTLVQMDDPVSDTSGQLAAKLKSLCGAYKPPA